MPMSIKLVRVVTYCKIPPSVVFVVFRNHVTN